MQIRKNPEDVIHRIRIRLYPNNMQKIKGAYIARTINNASLNIEQVCAALKNRGGFTGSYNDLVEHVKQFFDEAAYQLCDGFAVNTGYFSIYPKVGGTFDFPSEEPRAEKHPVSFRFRARLPLKTLARHIVLVSEGAADLYGSINAVTDLETGTINEKLSPGGMFIISGHKIKVTGIDPTVGVYFVRVDGSGTEHKAKGVLAGNARRRLIGRVPELEQGAWKILVRTQFTGSGNTSLQIPRVVESSFVLSVG